MLPALRAHSQDFSNKGKDFWVGYGLHCRMFAGGGNSQDMVLYFATEAVTNVTVSIPLLGYTQTYNIAANTIFTSAPLPKAGGTDSRLITEGVLDKGIHISSDKPIVAYAHIYNGNVSGATLLFPTNTLGKDYYSVNFSQYSNEANSNCWFYAVATDTGTTTIEVIPSANTQTMTAGTTYTFNLTQGQVFNALGTESNLGGGQTSGVDLTGSRIRSISTGTGSCKRIAVFSGSGKINIKCPIGPSGNSADNYMVQAFPKTAWGKYYLTVPTKQMPNNYFRIAVSDPTTVVKFNGSVLGGLVNNFYYQVGATNTPNLIEADQPVMVAQYITSANQCGNTTIGSNGDPEVIYLSPVEQNIDKVILNSTPNAAISPNWHYVNVVIPNGGTALSSFKIDGVTIGGFSVHPQNPAYAYLVYNFSGPGQHIVQSDSGFNAIAYGYGNAESYGYNAGANVKDLYQFISIQNQYATVNFPAGCKNSPFYFSMTFPYQPTQIIWNFLGLFPNDTLFSPVYDSTWFVNGRQLYRYKLPNSYTVATPGTYPIQVIATNPTPDGCGGEQEIDYDLIIYDRPTAAFSFSNNGCVYDTVQFNGSAGNTGGRPVVKWNWDFGDATTAAIQNPRHKFATQGSYTVNFSLITDVGCLSDTVSQTINLTDQPISKFGITAPQCIGQPISFSDTSTITTGATIVKWYWDFGDGSPQVIATTNATQVHSYNAAGNFTATLKTESNTGCQSVVFSKPVVVHPSPLAAFDFSDACLPLGATQFTDQSTIPDNSQNLFTYAWTFGDGGTSALKNPVHNYSALGPYNVTLTITSNNGCVDDTTRVMNTVYAQPQAIFTVPTEVCDGTTVTVTDQSTAPNSTVTQWNWNFGDGQTSILQNPPPHIYALPGTYNITLTVTSAVGCLSQVTTKPVTVNALPVAGFNPSAPACATRNVTFTNTSVANSGSLVKWTWDFGDGTNTILNSGAPFVHVYANPGVYNVTLQVETDKGCISTVITKQVTVSVLPKAGFIAPEICLADPFAPFIDTSKIVSGSIVGWKWNFGDPNANAGNPNISNLQNPSHRYTVVGPYIATLIVTSDKGCTDTIAENFIVNGSIPNANFTVQNSNTLCSNRDVKITDASTVDFGSIVKQEIYWDYSNDPTIKTVNDTPVAGQNYIHTYPEFGTPATRTVTVRMVSYSGMTCLSVVTKTITLLATPTVQFDAMPGVCADVAPFQIRQAYITNALPGSGVFTGTAVSSPGVFSPSVATPGTYLLRYTYTGSNSCTNYKEAPITVFPVPTVTAGPDEYVLEGGFVTLQGSGSGNNLTYLWTPNQYMDNNLSPTPKVSPPDDIYYTLTVTSSDNCTAKDQVFVKVLKAPVIPNIFSPNGDGVHDRWEIAFLSTYPGCTIDIFNRYGQLVYHSVGYDKPWDGTINGKLAPVGTYYYLVNPKNGRKQVAGYVDLIR